MSIKTVKYLRKDEEEKITKWEAEMVSISSILSAGMDGIHVFISI